MRSPDAGEGARARAVLTAATALSVSWIMAVSFGPGDKTVASVSRNKIAKVWDLANKESMLTFPDHQNIVNNVAITADGKFGISAGEDGSIREPLHRRMVVGERVRSRLYDVRLRNHEGSQQEDVLGQCRKTLRQRCDRDGVRKADDQLVEVQRRPDPYLRELGRHRPGD